MVVTQTLKNAHLLRRFGAIPIYTDLAIDIPAGTTIELKYTVPDSYIWIKGDVKNGPIKNRVFNVDVYVDSSVEFQDVDYGLALNSESWECIAASRANISWTAVVTNTTDTTHTLDYLIRGSLIQKQSVDDFFNELFVVRWHPDDIKMLAEEIGKCVRK